MEKDVRSQVPPRRRRVKQHHRFSEEMAALESAADVVHVFANTGPWDGGMQLKAAIEQLARAMEPLMMDPLSEPKSTSTRRDGVRWPSRQEVESAVRKAEQELAELHREDQKQRRPHVTVVINQ